MITVEATGLKEFDAKVHRLVSLTDHVVLDSETYAAKVTVDTARPSVPVLTGAAAASLRVVDYSDGAAATGGNSAVPYYGWLEFGGDAGRKHSVHRATVPEGRYLRPAFVQNLDKIERKMDDLMNDAINEAGLS